MENALHTITPNPPSVFDRKERRFFVSPNLTLGCHFVSEDESESLSGKVVNISTNGVQVKTSTALDEGQQFVLRLAIPDYSNDVLIDATVRWEALTSDRHCYLGCSFDEPLDKRILTHLAGLGILERRVDDRKEANIDAMALQQLALPNDVRIAEYSKGGLSLISAVAMDLESRIKITFPDSDEPIIVAPIWQLEKLGEYRIGCAFSNNHNYALVGKRVRDCDAKSFLAPSKINWTGLGVVAVLVWGLIKLCGF